MVDLTGANGRMSGNLLVGEIGFRVVNMIMTPAMFARLAVVSSDVQRIVCNSHAWEGVEIHLEHRHVRIAKLARMLRRWRRAAMLYLNYSDAASLEVHCRQFNTYPSNMYSRCCIAAVWRFPEVDVVSRNCFASQGSHTSDDSDYEDPIFLHESSVAFPAHHWVSVNVVFPAHSMPCFDVGWMCGEWNRWTNLCFRVVPQSAVLEFPEDDRCRWYAFQPMSDDPAIRVPSSWTSFQPTRLRIALAYSLDTMSLIINDRRFTFDIEPQFRNDWARRTHRRVIMKMSAVNPNADHPRIDPEPRFLPWGPSRWRPW